MCHLSISCEVCLSPWEGKEESNKSPLGRPMGHCSREGVSESLPGLGRTHFLFAELVWNQLCSNPDNWQLHKHPWQNLFIVTKESRAAAPYPCRAWLMGQGVEAERKVRVRRISFELPVLDSWKVIDTVFELGSFLIYQGISLRHYNLSFKINMTSCRVKNWPG